MPKSPDAQNLEIIKIDDFYGRKLQNFGTIEEMFTSWKKQNEITSPNAGKYRIRISQVLDPDVAQAMRNLNLREITNIAELKNVESEYTQILRERPENVIPFPINPDALERYD